jgi:Holliday junction DNA helicase RuvB
MNLPVDTLSDEIEPYLLREQFTIRTPRGRIATSKAYNLLGKEVPIKENQEDDNPSQSTLF